MKFSVISIALVCVILSSCASDSKGGDGSVDSSSSQAKEGLTKYEGGFTPVRDEETGFMRMETDKKSPFDTGKSPFSGSNDARNKRYGTDGYNKKSWNGQKKVDRKRWSGNSTYTESPEFVRQNSHYADSSAREGGSSYTNATAQYGTSAAYEQSSSQIQRPSNYLTESKQATYQQPKIISKADQAQSGRTVEDVKSLLND